MSASRVILSPRYVPPATNKNSETSTDLKDDAEENILPENVRNIAKLELREDSATRNNALYSFREWIAKNSDIKDINTAGLVWNTIFLSCPSFPPARQIVNVIQSADLYSWSMAYLKDANFLLRFLRVKKFSLPMAQQMLLKYLNLRQTFPSYFYNLDFLSPSLNELIESGYMFPSPSRDHVGRRVIVVIARNLDPHKYSNADLVKIHALTYETLLCDETTQVAGVIYFGDICKISPAVLSYFSPNEFATLIKWGEQSVPVRHKEIHLINVPLFLKYAYEFFQSRLSEKVRSRIMVHSSLDEVKQNIDCNLLPKEYGGKIPIIDMIDMWKKELMKNREKLLNIDKMILLNNKSLITRTRQTVQGEWSTTTSISGSFRKLELD